ncbi:hypothetical protein QK292_11715 [Arthrobacter sp. AL08]|uniref:hypothetical protein n=1 Tax=Micrococcaceae TaxID=1268 RepID=UPI001CFFBC92|nr:MULTISPECIES: hypothetical protein [Micrococcaceae]MCB5283884.1 hypothetical protein [Arthrobacter sp. ES1]MDI3242160.1 hypothetical protein [Arthrobacter sp. AL05]MDI3278235.1 hypothetical protein [Arthrobacter sp. AL08]MDJ0353247.1 hypothetical protein [Pseudarthrobacter sp. PH31-O2]WGZ80040.1 hypothetical protein QI450_01990 [Arthrobacter sp. EM1]
MPKLLMSTTSLRTSSRPPRSFPGSLRQEYRRSPEVDSDLGPLRLQVSGIIDSILADTKPEEAAVREKLRWHVANHPGQPEKALLSHLLSVSVQAEAG